MEKQPKRSSAAAKLKAQPAAKGKAARKTVTEDSGGLSKKDAQAAERMNTQLSNATNTKKLLAELLPDTLWKSLVRATELERRVTKGNSANRDLEKICASPTTDSSVKKQAEDLQTEITSLVECVNSMKQFFTLARSDPKVVIDEIRGGESMGKHFAACAEKLLSDHSVLIDFVHVVSKKLVDESWLCNVS